MIANALALELLALMRPIASTLLPAAAEVQTERFLRVGAVVAGVGMGEAWSGANVLPHGKQGFQGFSEAAVVAAVVVSGQQQEEGGEGEGAVGGLHCLIW